MRAVRVAALGGPEVLSVEDVDDPVAAQGQVVVDVAAAGLNFIDVYHRTGLYEMPLPFTAGLEGAGTIASVGADVAGWTVGDRVAWPSSIGSFAEQVALPADRIVAVPDEIDLDTAAAVMVQGITAHYLTHDSYALTDGDRCLIHAGAGGVGLLAIQMAKVHDAEVFTTVGSAEKAELARAAGADHTILYRDVDFVAAIEQIAGPRPIDVVYDGVGAATFEGGLRVLRRRGMMVTFGNASGPVEPISPLVLSRNGSLFLTRPTMFDHVATNDELERRTRALFGLVAGGRLDVRIGQRLPLVEVAEAHRLLEGRRTTGKVILAP